MTMLAFIEGVLPFTIAMALLFLILCGACLVSVPVIDSIPRMRADRKQYYMFIAADLMRMFIKPLAFFGFTTFILIMVGLFLI